MRFWADSRPSSSSLGAAGGGRETQAGGAEAAHELAALDLDRSGGDQLGAILLRDVVVVTLEPSSWDAGAIGELVEFVVRRVTHQMTPFLAAPPPARFVDQDRHPVTLPHDGWGTLGR